MLSGIGDGAALRDKDIPVIHDLAGVGQNLQDHLQARPVFKTTASTINIETRHPLQYVRLPCNMRCRAAAMAMAASLGTGFLKTRPELETPDIQFHIQPFSADRPGTGTHPFRLYRIGVAVATKVPGIWR